MFKPFAIICFCVSFWLNTPVYGQNNNNAKGDSLKIYKRIQHYAQKHRITRWIYQGIFREIDNPVISNRSSKEPVIIKSPFEQYTGKTIARIGISTEEPFGTSVNDTLTQPGNSLEKGANYIHIRTLPFTVRQQLLFAKGESLDPLKISESERLLRQTAYAQDAKIIIKPVGKGDSVEAIVIVRDKWSISVIATTNTSTGNVGFHEDNALGLGHQFENGFTYSVHDPSNMPFNGRYTINNIAHSYINAIGSYDNNPGNNFQTLSVGRGFYSALTKWAGSIDVGQYNTQFTSNSNLFPLHYTSEDLWLGRSLALSNKTLADRSSAIILSGRVANTNYSIKPPIIADSTRTIQNSRLYLGSIGFSSRHYYKDRNIYRFGVTEDVPEGRLLSFTGGYELRETNPRFYTGVRLAIGNHLRYGSYFAWSLEYGTYIDQGQTKNGVINASATWFSDLLYLGRWSIRQFVYYKSAFGIYRQTGDKVNLSGSQGLLGFDADVLGSSKTALNLQTVIYTPVNIIGFRIATVLFAGYGTSGNDYKGVVASKIYQVYGIGLLVRNENLIIRTFQLSFGFYPNTPEGNPPYKYNPLSFYNVDFPGFSAGKPSPVAYQ